MIRKAMRSAGVALSLLLLGLTAAVAQQSGAEAIEHAKLMGALALEGELFHVQGVDLDSRRIWVTSVDRENHKGYLHEFDRTTGRFLRRVELTDGARYHPGGISLHGRSIWVPVAELRANSSAVLEEIDTETLQIRRKIHVADHLGCVAVSDRKLIAGNWDSRLLYIFDLRGGAPVRVVPNPSATPFQDMKFVNGQLVGSGLDTVRLDETLAIRVEYAETSFGTVQDRRHCVAALRGFPRGVGCLRGYPYRRVWLLRGLRIHAAFGQRVVPTVVRRRGLGPELLHDLDVLVRARAPMVDRRERTRLVEVTAAYLPTLVMSFSWTCSIE